MVRTARSLLLITGLALLLNLSLRAADIAEYKLGDRVTEDIITPIPLTVVDPAGTEEIKQKEETRIPIVMRFDLSLAEKAEENLRNAFSLQRSNFLRAIQAAYNKEKLTESNVLAAKFQRTLANYKKQNKGFPLTTNLAVLWARGDSGRVVQAALITRVREAMEHPIRPTWPPGLKLSYTLRIVPVSNATEVVTTELAEQRGSNMVRADLLHITRARTNLQGRFTDEEKAFSKFAAGIVQPNCIPELELTAAIRSRKIEGLQATDTYEVGQTIARAGQLVDRKVLAAIDQLREKTTPVRLQEQITVQRAEAAQVIRRSQWWIIGLASATGLSVLVIWWLAKRRRVVTLVPAKIGEQGTVPVSQEELRAGLMAQMAQLLRAKVVRGLISQRNQLSEAQQTAAAEMAELERRLNSLQAPLQERLRAYEGRIAELEKALSAKGDENRELIKAKIELIRKQLEAERSRNRLVLN